MPTQVVTPAASAVIATSDVKLHLRVDHSTEDTYIAALVTAATKHCEEVLSKALITQTLALNLDGFPTCRQIDLMRPPLQSVTSVQYVDDAGATQTFSSANYHVDTNTTPGRIVLDDTATWPSTDDRPNAVTITYVAGYGDASSDIPEDIKQAVYLIVGEWYRNRENSAELTYKDIPFAAHALLHPHRASFFA